MGDAFRGLTLRIGADARPLQQSLASIKSAASGAEQQLRAMNKALNFDSTNVSAMSSRLDLAEDKAKLVARATENIGRAMRQAAEKTVELSTKSGTVSGKISDLATKTREVYAATQKTQAEYNHINAELETIYNGVRKIVGEEHKLAQDSKELDEYMSKLKRNYGGATAAAQKLTQEMDDAIQLAHLMHGTGIDFGLEDTSADAKKLVAIMQNLRGEHKKLQEDLASVKSIEGYRAMQTQLIAMRSELRAASAEAVRFSTELYKMGSSEGLHKALADVRSMDGAIDAASASVREMDAAFNLMPTDIAAAEAKTRAMADNFSALRTKLHAAEEVVKKIGSDPSFDKQAAKIVNVYTALAKAEGEATEYKAKIREAEQAVEALNDEIKEGNRNGWDKQERSLQEVQEELRKAEALLTKYEAEFKNVDARHKSASMAVAYREASESVIKLRAELVKLDPAVDRLRILSERFRAIRTAGYGLYSTITPALMMIGRSAINAAEQIDSAYRDMRKTVNGTEEDFEHLKQAAIEFSRTHVTTAEQMLEIESIGGQLGIAVENLESFGEVVSNLDIATNIDANDIATYIGQLSNIMRDIDTSDTEQYQRDITAFSDALVRLGNNSAAQESNIMKVMMRIASLGNISGFTTPQLLGISTAIAATGQGAEAAGTAIARTFSNIEAAVGKGGDKLQAFAQISGMSASDFADAWNGDPIVAFTAFIKGLKQIDEAGGSVDGTLASLGINSVRQKQALEGLTNTFDIMTSSVNMSEDAWAGMSSTMADGKIEKAGDAAREAARKSEGFSGAIQMLRNNATALAESLAQGAAPLISGLAAVFQVLTGAVNMLPGPIKTAVVLIGSLAAAIGPLGIAIGAIGDGWLRFGETLTKMKQSILAAKVALAASAAAASEDAAANIADAAAQEMNAEKTSKNAAATAIDTAMEEANSVATAENAAATATETAMEEANTTAVAGNAAQKTILTGITGALTGAVTGLSAALGISNAMLLGYAAAAVAIGAVTAAVISAAMPANQLTEQTKALAAETDEAKAKYEQLSAEFGASSDEALAAKAAYDELNSKLQESSQTIGELVEETNKEVEASREMRANLKQAADEADSNVGSLLHTKDAINELRASDDDASKAKLAAYIATLNSEVSGYNLSVEDAINGTANFNNAMSDLEEQIRNTKLDNAFQGLVASSEKLDELQSQMDKLVEGQTYSLDELKARYESFMAGDITLGADDAAIAWADLDAEMKNVSADIDGYNEKIQMNLDKNKAVSEVLRLESSMNLERGKAIDYVNSVMGTNIGLEEVQEAAVAKEKDAVAEATEAYSTFADAVSEACEKYPELDELISASGMTYESLGAWLSDLGISVEDFAQNVEDMADKAADGFNRIDTESGTSLEDFMANLEHNKEVMNSWGDNMNTLWNQYGESGSEAVRDFLEFLGEAGPEQANLVAEIIEQGNLEEVAQAWADAGKSGREAYTKEIGLTSEAAKEKAREVVEAVTAAANEASNSVNGLSDDVSNIPEGKVNITDNTAEVVKTIDTVYSLIRNIPNGRATVTVDDDATWRIRAIMNTLSSITSVLHTVYVTTQERATGGISTDGVRFNAKGGTYDKLISAIPMHASGALNGIVARPTLTNIGWVGEDGAEAILHMGHAGGAVIPLTNQRYVRPFAQAVAANMGTRPSVTVNMNLNYDASDDAQQMLRDIERGLENYLNLEA